ncbi:MAG: TetR/AcrR family transcriptional regulator [Anaerolineae bacterium]|nr:TetR/AcrR family transcriptional regulator [Anaerolineae bacterium]
MTNDHSHTRAERLRQRSHARRDNERKELRQLILDAAGELFAQGGYEAFSLRQVAEQIGYSPGAIYRYYDDKDDLLFNVADEGFKRFSAMQAAAAQSGDNAGERLRAMAKAYIDFGLQYPNYYRLMFMERPDLLFKSREAQAMEWLNSLGAYQAIFTAAIQGGVLREGSPVAMSDAWWAMLHGIVALGISMNFLLDPERINTMMEAGLDMFFHGFGNSA